MNPALWKVGTSGNVRSEPGVLPSARAELCRQQDDRARLRTDLPVMVDERLIVELAWPDGATTFSVVVYATHRDIFVDVNGWQEKEPSGATITVRKVNV